LGAHRISPRKEGRKQLADKPHDPIRCFCCDFNWSMLGPDAVPSVPQDWAFVDPGEYFDWHRDFGNNVCFCQAYAFGGYAFYETELGPVAPGPGREFLPRLYHRARAEKMLFWSYMCVGTDLILSKLREGWTVPGTGFLALESPWTDLLCDRIREFLSLYPVDWLLFDWFAYGELTPVGHPVQPAPFVREPFEEIVGRPMPEKAEEIAPEENLAYKREVLARQFHRIREAVQETSPRTKIAFNVPYQQPASPLWVDHPMLQESDGLFSECTDTKVMEWVLSVRQPWQRVMTTLRGQAGEGLQADPTSWRRWYEEGCDFFGYAFGRPPDFRPHPKFEKEVSQVREAFHEMIAASPH
jgi:hypothetical protein